MPMISLLKYFLDSLPVTFDNGGIPTNGEVERFRQGQRDQQKGASLIGCGGTNGRPAASPPPAPRNYRPQRSRRRRCTSTPGAWSSRLRADKAGVERTSDRSRRSAAAGDEKRQRANGAAPRPHHVSAGDAAQPCAPSGEDGRRNERCEMRDARGIARRLTPATSAGHAPTPRSLSWMLPNTPTSVATEGRTATSRKGEM